jgi:hypothetical protein
MKWFRSLAAELFPSRHERRLRQLKGDNGAHLESLAKLRRTPETANIAEMDRDGAGRGQKPRD